MCSSIPHSTPLFYPLPHRTCLAVSLNDRKSRVRRPSCRRRRRRLIRLPANPVASDGATAGWMNMITHSHTGLTPQLHLSWLSLLICLRAAACLPLFLTAAIPQCSRLRHSGVKSEHRGAAIRVIMHAMLPTFNTSPRRNLKENTDGAGRWRQRRINTAGP